MCEHKGIRRDNDEEYCKLRSGNCEGEEYCEDATERQDELEILEREMREERWQLNLK